jgi:hypothetical protein
MPPTIDERLHELAEATHEQLNPSPDLLGRIRASTGQQRQHRRARPMPLLGLAAVAAVIVAAVAVMVTWPSTHHQPNAVATAPGCGAWRYLGSGRSCRRATSPVTAAWVAQMLAAGKFATIASEVEPRSERSADQAVLEQAWGDLTTWYGTLQSTETQDEDLFPPAVLRDNSGGVVDETVLQMSYGLILLRVTPGSDGALAHVELVPLLDVWPSSEFTGPPLGF